jgi:hypothetical protein
MAWTWNDYRPVLGENSWANLLAPLQVAYQKYGKCRREGGGGGREGGRKEGGVRREEGGGRRAKEGRGKGEEGGPVKI